MWEISTKQWILFTASALLSFKIILIPAYVSTDFEVHRNWMAVTWNRPLAEWYTENTSEWTLDYPPFFAFFEFALAHVAHFLGIDGILEISSTPKFSQQILFFQRFSVIFMDVFYILACALYAFHSPKLTDRIPVKLRPNARQACFVLLAALPTLLLCDSIHFQYNSMLTSLFLISMYFVDCERYLMAALSFSVLLNFKHIYVYYALGYVFFYLINYFRFSGVAGFVKENFPKALLLAASLLFPFLFSLLPFIHVDGFQALQNIAIRLFPVSRGLTHAFWAPNFWALYNFADLLLYRILSIMEVGKFDAPTYTSGLVQEYSHSVLPNISPVGTLFLVTAVSTTVLFGLIFGKGKDFSLFAVLSALSFFYFGYHVHEKAIILITVPMTIFAIKDPKYLRHLVHISTISSFTVFPLIFTLMEIPIKYAVAIAYFLLLLAMIKHFTRMPLWDVLPKRHVIAFGILTIAEFYHTFIHHRLFSGRLPFAPLMAISVLNAFEVTAFFVSLFWNTFLDGIIETTWQKGACRVREQLIRDSLYPVQTIEDEEDVQLVAGVDISASKTNPDTVVISMSVWKYPTCEHVKTVADTRILRVPYIPQYLAIREAETLAEFVKDVMKRFPHLRPDVLMCDGFGQYHSRDCGMACHVGALTGVPSIGVAKNLTLHHIYDNVGAKNKLKVDRFVDNVRLQLKSNKPAQSYIPFDFVLPVKLNIIRMGSSMSGVFVSAGYGIDLELATKISVRMLQNNTTCEPIRAADLSSRELVRKHFDSDGSKKKRD
uniref:Alpha-1,3-glucosyltransferase n=2 Tax=Caenorhabditis japonica TaxID=281687 RepID=A0A8R1DUU5_CAEJA